MITPPYLFTNVEAEIPPTLEELVEWEKLMKTAYEAQNYNEVPEAQAERNVIELEISRMR